MTKECSPDTRPPGSSPFGAARLLSIRLGPGVAFTLRMPLRESTHIEYRDLSYIVDQGDDQSLTQILAPELPPRSTDAWEISASLNGRDITLKWDPLVSEDVVWLINEHGEAFDLSGFTVRRLREVIEQKQIPFRP